jgi:hypothetical protein
MEVSGARRSIAALALPRTVRMVLLALSCGFGGLAIMAAEPQAVALGALGALPCGQADARDDRCGAVLGAAGRGAAGNAPLFRLARALLMRRRWWC